MRIKSVKRTNQYKHINFEEIANDWEQSEVYTPDGWAPVLAFDYVKSGPSKVITIGDFTLCCDPGHIVKARRGNNLIAIEVENLDPSSDKLISYNKEVCFKIEDGPVRDFYDITIDNPHWWYTASIISHNSILLCNNVISSLKGANGDGTYGQDVLLVTFELDTIKTAMRCLGVMAEDIPINRISEHEEYVSRIVEQVQRTYNKRLLIVEWAPDECSVNHLYALLDNVKRTESWKPDVIVVDYMDLMLSRNDAYNKDDYDKQKHVANELRGLAKNENVLLFTATQANRAGATSGASGEGVVDLNKAAESFAKQFSLDYVVSLNQSDSERRANPPRIRMFIAKNRNGPKNEIINCTIQYETMVVREQP